MKLWGGDPLGGPGRGAVVLGSTEERSPVAGTERCREAMLGMREGQAGLGLGCPVRGPGCWHFS